ncbi:cytochrome P450 [Phellopilus nigrolimitatus]|nr:cytochrome P450 [Phellopilus nigrolimitatus]
MTTSWTLPAFSFRDAMLLDVAGALLVHGIYNRCEVDPSNAFTTFFLLVGMPSIATTFLSSHYTSTLPAVVASFSVFYVTLLSSIVIYRISFLHPLANYPGPFLAKISKFHGMWKMSSGKNHIYHYDLHKRYGPFVRVGPNELSIVDASSISSILGAEGLPKGPMWDARRSPQGPRSLIAIRDVHEHARRRKPWNRAFNTTSVKGYEPIVVKRALQLVEELEKRSQTKGSYNVSSVDLAEWMGYFTFDFMGDMAFGGGFETMRDGVENVGLWHALESGIITLSLIQHIPWVLHVLFKIPGSTKNIIRLRQLCAEAVIKRKKDGSSSRDLFHHLIDEEGIEKEAPTDAQIMSDGLLAIVAGSDTTATVLSGLFYHLLQHPEDYRRLQKEVDESFPHGEADPFDAAKLSEMIFLNAVINEALRVSPPANILQRGTTVDTGGRWLGKNFVPEGTAIDVPIYTLFRDPRYFSPAPEEFWPDRWLQSSAKKRTPKQEFNENATAGSAQSDGAMNAAAFIPFSYGPVNCAGRNLALVEMRMVVALLIQRFEMRLEDGYDPRDWDKALEDRFVMKIGKLPVVLKARA